MALPIQLSQFNNHLNRLLQLGEDGSPVYSNEFSRLNTEVFQLSECLFGVHGGTPEEEASLCIALLTGYGVTVYNGGDKEEKIQVVLDRAFEVLSKISDSLIKCKLLLCCYYKVYEEELLKEAQRIMTSWEGRELTEEEKGIMGEYNEIVREI